MIDRLESFRKVKILVVGDLMLDRYCWGRVTRISPEAPVPVVKLERSTAVAGGAANVAVNVAMLGAKCSLAGMVGTDKDGEDLLALLDQNGIDSRLVVRSVTRPTSVKTRVIAHNQQIVRIDQEDTSASVAEERSETANILRENLGDFDAVIVSDYAKGYVDPVTLASIFSQEPLSGRPVLVDPKGKDFKKYCGAFLITPNRIEAVDACKLEHHAADAVQESGSKLLLETGIPNILVTEGENGMTLFRKNETPVHIEAAHQEVYDVTGAGDSVIACLGVAIAAGIGLVDACRLANIAAGISVRKVGTNPVLLSELQSALAGESN